MSIEHIGDEPRQRRATDADLSAIASRIDLVTDGLSDMRSDMKIMASAINKLAVIDERQVQAALAQDRAFKVIEKLEVSIGMSNVRISALERASPMSAQIQSWVLAAVWGCAGLVIMFIVKKVGVL